MHLFPYGLLIIFAEVVDKRIEIFFDVILPVLHQFKLYMNLPLLIQKHHNSNQSKQLRKYKIIILQVIRIPIRLVVFPAGISFSGPIRVCVICTMRII